MKSAREKLNPKIHGGTVLTVAPGSLAAALGLRPGDVVLAVNGHPVADVIDVQFYAADDTVAIAYRRGGNPQSAIQNRKSAQPLGLDFAHPTFDIDIRRCNNRCPFCFVLQMAPRLRRALYIKDDDFRYSFLYGHYVTLTNLSAPDWQRIEQQHLSPLYISVHATDLQTRRRCLGNPAAPGILNQLRWLARRGIEMHTQIVVTPGLNDGARLEKSVRDLAKFYPAVQSVSVVPVGLTKHHKYGQRLNTVAEAGRVLAAVQAWQAEFLPRCGVRFVYPTDEWFLLTGQRLPAKKYYAGLALEENGLGQVRGFLEEWKRVKKEFSNPKPQIPKSKIKNPTPQGRSAESKIEKRKATLVTGKLFEETLGKTVAEFNQLAGTELEVVGVVNERLGRSVTVAGLLLGQDVLAQLADRDLGELVILPRSMFDHPCGLSLDDVSPLAVARRLGRPVFVAETMGDVLAACAGRHPLRFDPAAAVIPPEVLQAGGWVVEQQGEAGSERLAPIGSSAEAGRI